MAQAGVLIVIALAAIIIAGAAQAGFPAIRSGELPLWGLKVYPFAPLHNWHTAGQCPSEWAIHPGFQLPHLLSQPTSLVQRNARNAG